MLGIFKKKKKGKNRPLDDSELEFLDSVQREQLEKERARAEQEDAELRMFREARLMKEAADAKAADRALKVRPTLPFFSSFFFCSRIMGSCDVKDELVLFRSFSGRCSVD